MSRRRQNTRRAYTVVVVLPVGFHYSILRLYVTHQWSFRGSVAALRLELVAWIYQCSGVHRSEQGVRLTGQSQGRKL